MAAALPPAEPDRSAVPNDAEAQRADEAPMTSPDSGVTDAPAPGDAVSADATPTVDETVDPSMLSLGRVGKPHSLDGTVRVTRPRGRLLLAGTIVTIAGVEREIVHRGGTDPRPLLHLSGVDGIDAAEALRGREILIPREVAPELDEDEFWPEQLVGLPVSATTGEPVGEVTQVLGLPSCDVLEVRRPEGADLLVPLHREAVPELDVAARRVVIDLDFMGEAPSAPTGDDRPAEQG